MILNSVISSGGDVNKSQIIVTTDSGSVVTCAKGSVVKNAREDNGQWRFTGIDTGTWTVRAQKDGMEASAIVKITRLTVEYVNLIYRKVPEFTYSGSYELVDDNDNPLTDMMSSNWKIRLLSSGVLSFDRALGWDGEADVFMVGGGASGGYAGGGGSGYTKTETMSIEIGKQYAVEIGAGGTAASSSVGADGGATVFGALTARGGLWGRGSGGMYKGGAGGSGGGTGGYLGGQDGGYGGGVYGGEGQGTTTREFGEDGARLYASGGSGNESGETPGGGGYGGTDRNNNGGNGQENTGSGGGGNYGGGLGGSGGSGIVIIRNHR